MNDQWAREIEKTDPEFFPNLAKGQSPQVLWIGCSDSRVPESVICNVLPGEIFTTRNIANQFLPDDDSANSVLAYAVNSVGVQHVIVAGHTNCGGVKAALEAAFNPPSEPPTTALGRWLLPLINLAVSLIKDNKGGKEVDATMLMEENVKEQVKNVIASPTIRAAWSSESKNKVYIHGWVFDIARGRLRSLGVSQGPPA